MVQRTDNLYVSIYVHVRSTHGYLYQASTRRLRQASSDIKGSLQEKTVETTDQKAQNKEAINIYI
jgi:hypothetical protein